ncbi:MAG: M24 family metallopeptidase [Bryobacterales bacterium]|nr:M24 family metallopeptidase [Bryobacterales bacterium]
MEIGPIQKQLLVHGYDGWLLFDHHVRDPIAYRVLGLDAESHVSRRWYYWIPAEGEPAKLVHAIEDERLDSLPGTKRIYTSWQSHRRHLGAILEGSRRVAMQYSPDCMIPVVSLVDAGTVDLVRSLGAEVVSSADLVQYFEARWTDWQRDSHFEAGRRVDGVLSEAFRRIRSDIGTTGRSSEYGIAQFILERFREEGMVTMDSPIVAVNANSGDPHYGPDASSSRSIGDGDFVLIDLWAKIDAPGSVYYDITWTGYCGQRPPSRIRDIFEIVVGARDKALATVDAALRSGRQVAGCEVDDVTRRHIARAGYGDAFVHRTGHSIGEEVHGNGANLDNLEMRDERQLIPHTCFSIEPGIYLAEFGVRSEIDCFVEPGRALATGAVQTEIVRI